MNLESTMAIVLGWLIPGRSAGLELPDGWLGRPDDRYRLSLHLRRKEKLILELDGYQYLIITRPRKVESAPTELRITLFDRLTFDGLERGKTETSHANTFTTGQIRFVAD